jgi:hypothetical protein
MGPGRTRIGPVRRAAVLAVLLYLGGCRSGEGTLPPPLPEVAGAYDFTAPLSEMQGYQYVGTFTLVDDDRATPEFAGSYTWTFADVYGRTYGSESGKVGNGRVRADGRIELDMGSADFHVLGSFEGTVLNAGFVARASSGFRSGPLTAHRR